MQKLYSNAGLSYCSIITLIILNNCNLVLPYLLHYSNSNQVSLKNVHDRKLYIKNNRISVQLSAKNDNVIQNDNNNGVLNRQIISLAIPALAALSIDPLMSLVDTAMVGNWAGENNPVPLSSMGSSTGLLTFAFYIFNFLCNATAPLVSNSRASNNFKEVREISGQSLTLALLLGIILTIALSLGAPYLLTIMGTDITGSVDASEEFVRIRAIAAPAVLLCTAAIGIMRGCLDTKTPIYVLLIANILNLTMNFLFIYVMNMGSSGAAVATTLAEWSAAIMFLLILRDAPKSSLIQNNNLMDLKERQDSVVESIVQRIESPLVLIPTGPITPISSIPQRKDIQQLFNASASIFLRTLVLQLCLTSAASLVARASAITTPSEVEGAAIAAHVAAHQIAIQLWLLCSFLADALAAAGQTLVADALGRDEQMIDSLEMRSAKDSTARKISNTILAYSAGLGLVLAIGLCGAVGLPPHLIPFTFTQDGVIVAALLPVIPLIIISQPINAIVFAADGIVQGSKDFLFQAQSMLLSAIFASVSFISLQNIELSEDSTTLLFLRSTTNDLLDYNAIGDTITRPDLVLFHVWISLMILQIVRGGTSLWRIQSNRSPLNTSIN